MKAKTATKASKSLTPGYNVPPPQLKFTKDMIVKMLDRYRAGYTGLSEEVLLYDGYRVCAAAETGNEFPDEIVFKIVFKDDEGPDATLEYRMTRHHIFYQHCQPKFRVPRSAEWKIKAAMRGAFPEADFHETSDMDNEDIRAVATSERLSGEALLAKARAVMAR